MDLLLSGLRVMSVGGRNWAIVIAGCGSPRVARMPCANRPRAGREAMRFIFSILFIISSAFTAAAQSQVKLQSFFEGKQVTLRIDMPSADGVDVYPERSQSLDYDEYRKQLRKGGVSIKRGSTAIIDSVKVHERSCSCSNSRYSTVTDLARFLG
jgi:hypothetical protein